MQRFLKKPLEMKVKDFVERAVSPTVPAAKIVDNKILDLMESATPISCQRHMVLQGFDPMDGTIAELVNFCERIKSTKELLAVKKTSHEKTGKDHNKGKKKGAKKRKPKGVFQALTTVCCMDQTKTKVLKSVMPSRIL